MAENSYKPTLLLASIGVPYSLEEDLLSDILPERALCLASPYFYKDAKSCNLTYTLIKNNSDLFLDEVLKEEILLMSDKLAAAFLGGILLKSNRERFKESIEACRKISRGFDKELISRPLKMLAEMGVMQFDEEMFSFGLRVNEIKESERKKRVPREHLVKRNIHFQKRIK